MTIKNLNCLAIVPIDRTVGLSSVHAKGNKVSGAFLANVASFSIPKNVSSIEDTAKLPKDSDLPASQFVSDESTVVRGGKSELPSIGSAFSAAVGSDKYDAGKWIPHRQMRVSTASAIRAYGGTVIAKPEVSRSGVLNDRHVEVVEGRSGAFGEIEPNPVPKLDRIG